MGFRTRDTALISIPASLPLPWGHPSWHGCGSAFWEPLLLSATCQSPAQALGATVPQPSQTQIPDIVLSFPCSQEIHISWEVEVSPGSSGVAEGCQGTGQLTARSDAIFVSQALLLIPAGSGHATTPPPKPPQCGDAEAQPPHHSNLPSCFPGHKRQKAETVPALRRGQFTRERDFSQPRPKPHQQKQLLDPPGWDGNPLNASLHPCRADRKHLQSLVAETSRGFGGREGI